MTMPSDSRDRYDPDFRQNVSECVARIAASVVLGERSRLGDVLAYLSTEELDGRSDRTKDYTIATDVFGRPEDFDPTSDSIFRVEINRLGQALDHYYATHGENDPVRIEIPHGTYQPRLERLSSAEGPGAAPARETRAPRRRVPLGARHFAAAVLAASAILAVGAVTGWQLTKQPETAAPPQAAAVRADPPGGTNSPARWRPSTITRRERLRKTPSTF
ncbi:MAG: hypothetical protein VW547_12030 [Alphaproteobacteria bacterium]